MEFPGLRNKYVSLSYDTDMFEHARGQNTKYMPSGFIAMRVYRQWQKKFSHENHKSVINFILSD